MAHVVVEVEARIVDPERPPHLEAREGELLAVARHQVEPRLDVVGELLARGRRALEDHQRADVHVRRLPLLVKEGGVNRAEPVLVRLLSPPHVQSLTRRLSAADKVSRA